jgi:hypothetical protein
MPPWRGAQLRAQGQLYDRPVVGKLVIKSGRLIWADYVSHRKITKYEYNSSVIPSGGWGFSLRQRVQNGSGAHPASYPMGTRDSFPGSKAAGA